MERFEGVSDSIRIDASRSRVTGRTSGDAGAAVTMILDGLAFFIFPAFFFTTASASLAFSSATALALFFPRYPVQFGAPHRHFVRKSVEAAIPNVSKL
jgi:hypothetical protein